MNTNQGFQEWSFLIDESLNLDYSVFCLNLYLNGLAEDQKPYKINYQTVLTSYYLWPGQHIEEFCLDQALSYFMLNPMNDSPEAREAMSLEIREFLSGK